MRLHGMMLVMAVAALPATVGAQEREASDDNDLAVHAFLSAVDLGELQSSLLATRRATSAEVRGYAQEMLGDHGNALHTREMLMQTENSGLVQRMVHTENHQIAIMPHSNPAASGGAGTAASMDQALLEARPGTPTQAPTESHVVVEETTAGSRSAHVGNGVEGGSAVDMTMPPGVTLEMVQELEVTLAAHPMSQPVMAANARNLQVLQGVTGPQFDKLYMDAQIGAHRYALSNIDRMLSQSGALGDDIRGTLQQTRTAIAAHLQTAEQIRARLM
jgi:predicted outer membrane protein